jgi:hypothetical protein
MSDTESDEDLKRAIALSLAEQSPSSITKKAIVVDLISSDDDDDLDAPVTGRMIASSKKLSNEKDKMPSGNSAAETVKPATTTSDHIPSEEANGSLSGSTNLSFLGLDRKKMEEERLLRAQQRKKTDEQTPMPVIEARKRKASSSPPQLSGPRTRTMRPKLSESATSSTLPILSFKDQERALRSSGVQFLDGIVKKTWVYGCPRQDDIKIEEVLQKDDLELAVLSSFQIDPDWIASKLHPSTKVVFVLQARTEAEVGSLVFYNVVSIFYAFQDATPLEGHECAQPRGRGLPSCEAWAKLLRCRELPLGKY